MGKQKKILFAKVMIFFSFLLIGSGIFIQVKDYKLINPESDVTILSGKKDDVTVTPADKDNIVLEEESTDNKDDSSSSSKNDSNIDPSKDKNQPELKPEPKPETKPDVKPLPEQKPKPVPTPVQPPKPKPEPKPVVPAPTPVPPPPKPTPEPPPPKPVEPTPQPVVPPVSEQNLALRKELENNYGISIKYGDEVAGYSVGGMSTILITDPNVANKALNDLKVCLSRYPSGFFQEIKRNGFPLSIYLIKKYSTANVTGVTDSQSRNIIISVATDFQFDDTLHHEVYHYVEKFIFSKGFRFTSWNTLNPIDFTYGNINPALAYSKTYRDDAPFVNSYAQTNEYEDRASTFEYMMMPNKASCLNQNKPVWLKAKTMSEQIDFFMDSVKPNVTEYWERFIY